MMKVTPYSQKSLKTCLRYPGGKSKAIKTLSPWFPKTISEYREPFIGGGSIAIEITKSNPDIPVWINDLYVPLYNFWTQLRDRGEELSERVREEKQRTLDEGDKDKVTAKAKELFNKYKEEIDTYNDFEKAVAFFIMNKCSFSGLTENSTFSQTASNSNFSLVGADKLAQFSKLIEHWKITNIDYSEVMREHGSSNTFVFLDPPYDIKDFLYGKNREMHKSFDHDRFAEDVYNCVHKFMITYNVNDRLMELYKNYNLKEWKLRYSMAHRGDKGTDENIKTELLVTNYSIVPQTPLELALS
jgi:DNA adenine methylase